jgi:hypothetical protein
MIAASGSCRIAPARTLAAEKPLPGSALVRMQPFGGRATVVTTMTETNDP